MASQQQVTGELLAYVRAVSLREDDILRELREKTATFPAGSSLQVMAEEGQLLALLVGLTGGRIEVRIGDAAVTMARLVAERGPACFDLVFIDADKKSYARYYEAALTLVSDRGLIVVDNTLFFGRVADPSATDPETEAIREFNEALRDDPRVVISLLPVADGITLICKKAG